MLIEKDGVLNCVFLLMFTNLSLFFFIIISILRKLFKGGFFSRSWLGVRPVVVP